MTLALGDDEIEDRFFVLSRMEILSVLNDLIHRREPVTIGFDDGRQFFQTTLLEARQEALIFDLGGDREANDRLLKTSGCVFVARPEGVRVQFSGGRVRRFSWGGADAFWVPLPERIVRLQRRESFRVVLPVAGAPRLSLLAEGGGRHEFLLHDLCVAGLGARVVGEPGGDGELVAGARVPAIGFALPERERIECPARIRHLTLRSDGRGGQVSRLGLAFDGLPRRLEVAIQRYIIELEHARRELLGNPTLAHGHG